MFYTTEEFNVLFCVGDVFHSVPICVLARYLKKVGINLDETLWKGYGALNWT